MATINTYTILIKDHRRPATRALSDIRCPLVINDRRRVIRRVQRALVSVLCRELPPR